MSSTKTRSVLRLRVLTISDEMQARAAHLEMLADDFAFLLDTRADEDWPAYLSRLEGLRSGETVPIDRVPATFLVAEVEDRIVGRISVRHQLNAALRADGGHIGFGVRPRDRGSGFATEMVRQALVVACNAGVRHALLTCDEGNEGSRRTIVKNGGELEQPTRGQAGAMGQLRYWIETSKRG